MCGVQDFNRDGGGRGPTKGNMSYGVITALVQNYQALNQRLRSPDQDYKTLSLQKDDLTDATSMSAAFSKTSPFA